MAAMLQVNSSPRAKRVARRPSLVDITNTLPAAAVLFIRSHSDLPTPVPSPTPSPTDTDAAHYTTKPLLRHTSGKRNHQRGRRLSPISKLPAELLIHIALLGTREHFHFPILFSHVCRLWRSLALATPEIWHTIVLCKSFDALLPPSYIHAILTRGRGTPVNIKLDLGLHRKSAKTDDSAAGAAWRANILLETVEPHVERWRSLDLSLPSSFDLPSFLARVLPRAKELEKLALHRADGHRLLSDRSGKAEPRGGGEVVLMPKLRELKVDGFPLPGCVGRETLRGVRELSLVSIPEESRLSAGEALDLVREARWLEKLTLVHCLLPASARSGPGTASTSSQPEPLTLPRLTSMDVSHNPTSTSHSLLASLRLPSLRSLVLGSAQPPEPLGSLTALVSKRRYPVLRWVRLGYGSLEKGEKEELEGRLGAGGGVRGGCVVFGPVEVRDSGAEGARRRWEEGLAGKFSA